MSLNIKISIILLFSFLALSASAQTQDTSSFRQQWRNTHYEPGVYPDSLFTDISLERFESLFDYYYHNFYRKFSLDIDPESKKFKRFRSKLDAITLDEWIILAKIINTLSMGRYAELHKKKHMNFLIHVKLEFLKALRRKMPAIIRENTYWYYPKLNIYIVGPHELSIRYRVIGAHKLPPIHD
jgi:hypothetical protein